MAMRMTKFLKATLAFAFVSTVSSTALVDTSEARQGRCTNHNSFTTHLKERYGETPRGIGLVSEQGVMQVYVSEKGTWTILVTNPRGQACLIAAGRGWEDLKAENIDPEA